MMRSKKIKEAEQSMETYIGGNPTNRIKSTFCSFSYRHSEKNIVVIYILTLEERLKVQFGVIKAWQLRQKESPC